MEIKHTLPWGLEAIEPYISKHMMVLHFEKHHQGYVANYNRLIADPANSDLASLDLVPILQKVAGEIQSGNKARLGLFRNGAQAWNHDFLWKSIAVNVDSTAFSALLSIDFAKFRQMFIDAGMAQFGSGWVWIVQNGSAIDLCTTSNEESPLFAFNSYSTIINATDITKTTPLAVCDVWEHAYYLKCENRRAEYLEMFFDHLMNWDFACNNYAAPASATASGA